jgi:hypothetical protein
MRRRVADRHGDPPVTPTRTGTPTATATPRGNHAPDCSDARAEDPFTWPPNHELVPVHIVGVRDRVRDPLSDFTPGFDFDQLTADLEAVAS